jgi:hypothetical protein
MNIDEVIALADDNARAQGVKWSTTRILGACAIRTAENPFPRCPLKLAANRNNFIYAAEDLGLSTEDRRIIVDAADMRNPAREDSARVRQLMLDTFEFEN